MRRRWVVASVLIVGFLVSGPVALHAQSKGKIEIPNKFGIGLSLYNQTQPYEIESLEVELPGVDPGQLTDLDVQNNTSSYHLRLDYWLFPFLNIFGLVGKIEGQTTVDLGGIDIGLPVPINDLNVDIDGTVYGGGLVLAVGGKHWFSSVAYDYTETDLDVASSSVKASVVTPTVGYHFDGGAIWLGAMYQNAEERHTGIFELPFIGGVPFDVRLHEKAPWNGIIGGTAGFGEHWVLRLQGGFGTRQSALVTIEYRMF